MSEVYLGQIVMAGFNFAPRGFASCDGQLLAISQNSALFALLGTTYGGDGQNTFALPDLRGRVPTGANVSVDSGWQPPVQQMGQLAGTESVTLLNTQMPAHGHAVSGVSTPSDNRNPTDRTFANTGAGPEMFAAPGTLVPQSQQSLGVSGGSQPHPNMQPSAVINFYIATTGIFPPRS